MSTVNPEADYARVSRRTKKAYKDGCSAPNEDEVGRLLAKGANPRQIAALTNLAYRSVTKYMERLFKRYKVHSKEELVKLIKEQQKNVSNT